jgi:hypothetical protein
VKKYITPLQMEELFSVSLASQSMLRHRRQIPFTKMGRKVFYCVEDIEKMFEDNKIKSM